MPLIDKSLFVRLALLILTGTAIVVLALVTFNYFEMRRVLLHDQEQHYTALADSAALKFNQQLLELQKVVDEAAALYPLLPGTRTAALQLLERTMSTKNDLYGSAIALAPEQDFSTAGFQILYSWRGQGQVQVIDRSNPILDYQSDWFYLPYHLQRPVWTDPYYDADAGALMLTWCAPVLVEGQVRAVITGDLSLEGVEQYLEQLELGHAGYPLLVSQFGNFLVHPNHDWVHTETIYSLMQSSPAAQDRGGLERISRAFAQHSSGSVRFKRYTQDEYAWLYFSTVPQTGWKMGLIIPEKQILAPVFALGVKTSLIALGGILLLLLPAFLIARTVTKPIRILCGAAEQLAGGNFSAQLPPARRRDEIGRLILSFAQMRTDLRTYIDELTTTTAEKEKIASELSIARDIQHSILPKLFPPFPQRLGLDLFATLDSAREVGGDLYDFTLLDDNRLYICIGDVSGKGVPASLFMAVGKTLLKSTIQTIPDPAQTLFHVNNELAQGNDSCMFITAFCGIFDLTTRELQYSNAGHNPPVIMSADGVRMFEIADSPPLAVLPDIEYCNRRITLEPGEKLFLYTDGVNEAMDPDLQLFGEERMLELLAHCCTETAEASINRVGKELKRFAAGADQSDDITMLCMSYAQPSGGAVAESSPTSRLVLKSHRTELPRMVAWLEDLKRKLGWSDSLVTKLNLILEEWLVNVMSYAYPEGETHEIELRLWKNAEELRIEVRDSGIPFDPTIAAEPDINLPLEERGIGGLGLHFIRSNLDQWSYARVDEQNIVTMIKKLDS
ncbi:MAG: SpoIIE family protein phosphatase [Desulfuromonadaceae bacterium]|nr:SpoIIE family protein phosphatase [Desulfuromonas sp.]MDY0185321.1 SpoIIE family protein phosphatase [Desulfuromonadaceae bacterium]